MFGFPKSKAPLLDDTVDPVKTVLAYPPFPKKEPNIALYEAAKRKWFKDVAALLDNDALGELFMFVTLGPTNMKYVINETAMKLLIDLDLLVEVVVSRVALIDYPHEGMAPIPYSLGYYGATTKGMEVYKELMKADRIQPTAKEKQFVL